MRPTGDISWFTVTFVTSLYSINCLTSMVSMLSFILRPNPMSIVRSSGRQRLSKPMSSALFDFWKSRCACGRNGVDRGISAFSMFPPTRYMAVWGHGHFSERARISPIHRTQRRKPRPTIWCEPIIIRIGCRRSSPTVRTIMDPTSFRKN